VKTPEGYILNGTKQFITNGGEADIYTIVALTDKTKGPAAPAPSSSKRHPRFHLRQKGKENRHPRLRYTGMVFRNCLVPAENIISREGMGFIVTMKVLDNSRPGISAQALGIAQGALEAAVGYTSQRIQFGQPLISLPVVQYKLAEMALQVEAARALVYAVAKTIDSGVKSFTEESAMAKVFASDVAMKVTVDAVQVCGGAGYMRDYPSKNDARCQNHPDL